MEARVHPFGSRPAGLEGLRQWLLEQQLEASAANFVTDTLWFYYWYFVWPSAGETVPVQIAASSQPIVTVTLAVPVAADASTGSGVLERDVPMLQDAFARDVTEPLRDTVQTALQFVSTQTRAGYLDEQMAPFPERSHEYHTVVVGDLLEDLRSLLPPDGLEQWMESPNTRFGGATPRELLRFRDMRYLRDLILEARHGLPT